MDDRLQGAAIRTVAVLEGTEVCVFGAAEEAVLVMRDGCLTTVATTSFVVGRVIEVIELLDRIFSVLAGYREGYPATLVASYVFHNLL